MFSKVQVTSVRKDRSCKVTKRHTKDRKKFTPWLEQQLNNGNINGLYWIDKEQGIFRIPWVRVDKPEFDLHRDAELFKRWAQHTGKYRVGDQADPSTWKTRFRCALRKMQEIVEIKSMGNLEGSSPYRIFKFERKRKGFNSSGKHSSRKRRRPSTSSTDSNDACAPQNLNVVSYPAPSQLGEWRILDSLTNDLFGAVPGRQEFDIYFPGERNDFQLDDNINAFPGIRNVSSNVGISSGFSCWGQESNYLGLQAATSWQGFTSHEEELFPVNNEVFGNSDENFLNWSYQENGVRFTSWLHDGDEPTKLTRL